MMYVPIKESEIVGVLVASRCRLLATVTDDRVMEALVMPI